MNKYFFILFFILLLNNKATSQNFGALPYCVSSSGQYSIERILFDSIHNKLLVSSKWINYVDGKKVRGICSWNGLIWDSLGGGLNTHDILNNNPNSTIYCGIPYNGKFLVGGTFQSIGGINATSLATWNGFVWDSLPIRAFRFLNGTAFINGLYNYNNKIYLYGNFDTIQGQKANSLAIYNGTSFQPILLPIQSQEYITDLIEYKGELYISGVFTYSAQANNRHILKYDGTNWVSVGGGIKGLTSSISKLAVYNNELYAGGYFLKTDGNQGNIIMKWDGSNWFDVGWGNEYQNGGIWDLKIHHNKLYAFGTFSLAADNWASKVAVFNGTQWCTLSDSLDQNIFTSAIYRDTIYIAGAFKSINSDTTKRYIAKMIDPTSYNVCINVGLSEFLNNKSVSLYPNPATSIINIIDEQNQLQNTTIEITNYLGQSIFSEPFSNQIDISHFSSGVYTITIKTISGELYHAKFVRE